jgi:hypothetical protein
MLALIGDKGHWRAVCKEEGDGILGGAGLSRIGMGEIPITRDQKA